MKNQYNASYLLGMLPCLLMTSAAVAGVGGPVFSGGSLETPRAPVGLQLTDLDADGLLDVAAYQVTRLDDGTDKYEILVAYGLQGGSFTPWDILAITNNSMNGLGVGDLNHDGHLDIVAANSTGYELFLGNSTRGFGASVSVPVISTGVIQRFELVDYNNDGQDDLIFGVWSAERVVLVQTDSNGLIAESTDVWMPVDSLPMNIKFLDFNHNGLLDLFVATNSNATRVWLQNPATGFDSTTPGVYRELSDAVDFVLADINGDGVNDFVHTVSTQVDAGSLWMQSGELGNPPLFPPGFSSHTFSFDVEPHTSTLGKLNVTDIDNDGTQDVLLASGSGTTSGLYLLSGWEPPRFQESTLQTSTYHRDRPNSIQVGDIDLDGRDDIVTSYSGYDYRAGENVWGVRVLFNRNGCVADYNGDGDLNFFDVTQFVQNLNAHHLRADLNSDDQYDFFDVSQFLSVFLAGCP